MRYVLDINGYVLAVFWGCHSGNCSEYNGEVPVGYPDLITWSEDAFINAYYINSDGNLTLDYERQAELEVKTMMETIDNTPILAKDLVGSNEVLDSQYEKQTATGNILSLTNVQNIAPRVKLTGIKCYSYSNIDIYTQGYNMIRNDGKTETINGIDFTILPDGSIRINGTATANIEYNLSGSSTNASPIFVLKNNINYYLNLGGYSCEMKYYDGETTAQVYVGNDGVINLSESKKVTQVLLKIPNGTVANNVVIYPMLNYGTVAKPYETYKCKVLNIDFSSCIDEGVFPSDSLYPSDDLYPAGTTIDYILIEDGLVYVSKDGVKRLLSAGNVQLFTGNNIVYVNEDIDIELEYSIDVLKIEDKFNSRITRTEEEIKLEASKTYATKTEMNAAISVKANEITSTVSQTYETKESANTHYSQIKQTTDNINLEVGKKVNNEDFTGANIMLNINNDSSSATIDADKISLNGKEINLTSEDVSIKSNGLNVNKNGNVSIIDNTGTSGNLKIYSEGTAYETNIRSFGQTFQGANGFVGIEADFAMSGGTIQVSPSQDDFDNCTFIQNGSVECVTLTQTSLAERKKNLEKLEDNAIDIIKNIDIYKYNLKNENDTDKKHIGFVIGDDYNYSTEVTSLDNQGVDNYSFTSLCCKAIQEQQKIIEDLQKEIKELKEVK